MPKTPGQCLWRWSGWRNQPKRFDGTQIVERILLLRLDERRQCGDHLGTAASFERQQGGNSVAKILLERRIRHSGDDGVTLLRELPNVPCHNGVGSLTLSISDDGRGFDFEKGYRKSGHWGLKKMQECAANIRGKWKITTADFQALSRNLTGPARA